MFMDCLCIPKDCPHVDLVYGLINHILSPDPQTQFATEQSAGITNLKAVPTLPEELRTSYNYDDIDGFMQTRPPVPGAADRGRPIRHLRGLPRGV